MQNLDSYSKSLLNTAPPPFLCSLGNKAATGVQQEELLWVPLPCTAVQALVTGVHTHSSIESSH